MADTSSSGLKGTHITLYTNHRCPWAHRAHVALRELKLPYDEVIIPLDRPRDPWYLEVNPRGLVPSIKFTGGALKDEIITESAVVAKFLADAFPSHLVGPSNADDGKAALFRARADFFVDAWFSKVNSKMYPAMQAEGEEKEKIGQEILAAIEKEIEPLLKDAGPFFGGNGRVTIAEVLTSPFILRYYTYSNGEFLPKSLKEGMDKLPNFSKWAAEVRKQDSVTYIYDEEAILEGTRTRLAKMKASK